MKLDPQGSYLMPVGFGQQQPHSGGVFDDVLTLAIRYRTDVDALAAFLPEPFEPAAEPIVTVKYQCLRGVNILAGGAYNLLAVDLAAHYIGPSEDLIGDFSLVMWENDTRPIIRGRDVIGIPKIYADIPDALQDGRRWRAVCSEGGQPLVGMELVQGRAYEPDELQALNAPSDRKYFSWKYVPNVDGIGAAYSSPVSVGIDLVVDAAWEAQGTVRYGDLDWASSPGSDHYVAGLRTLTVREYMSSSVTKGSMTIMRAKHRTLPNPAA